jgi:hypothetical protein
MRKHSCVNMHLIHLHMYTCTMYVNIDMCLHKDCACAYTHTPNNTENFPGSSGVQEKCGLKVVIKIDLNFISYICFFRNTKQILTVAVSS